MTFRENLLAVLNGEGSERTPFCPDDNLAPRGALVLDLIRQDPARRLVIGMTEMGTLGVVDAETERIFTSGMRAIMDAVEEAP